MSSTLFTPKAGFCIKSSSLNSAVLPPPPSNPNLLEPTPGPIPIPKGLKVFINIAWDPQVPPPPEGNEDAIKRAMQGEDVNEKNPSAWYVPVVVSNARQDTDKTGNPSIVFDCIYNTTVKSRTLRDPDFKLFIVELALQRIESQTRLILSREIGTPNIASKGKLLPWSVHLPAPRASTGAAATPVPAFSSIPDIGIGQATSGTNGKAPLIQEISKTDGTNSTISAEPKSKTTKKNPNPTPGLRGIMKNSSSTASKLPPPQNISPNSRLDWSWTKEDSGRLRVEVNVPGLTRTLIQSSSLDIEPRHLTLSIPTRQSLDIDLAPSDAEIVSRISSSINTTHSLQQKPLSDSQETRKDQETSRTLQLKRQRDFDVDGAEAEWKVGSEVVIVYL